MRKNSQPTKALFGTFAKFSTEKNGHILYNVCEAHERCVQWQTATGIRCAGRCEPGVARRWPSYPLLPPLVPRPWAGTRASSRAAAWDAGASSSGASWSVNSMALVVSRGLGMVSSGLRLTTR